MGSFVFIWPNAGEEVFVTGTFDAWSKSVQLEKVGDVFQKTVKLKDASKKIYYKFVVDGEWVLDPAAPQEKDEEGNDNNVLTPENIIAAAPVAAVISSAAPESTTAGLAADAPIEEKAIAEKNLDETPITILPVTEEPPVAADAPPASVGILSSAAPIATTAALAGAVPLEPKATEKAVEEKPLDETPVTILPVTDAPVVAEENPASSAVISSAAPVSTTSALAGAVPLEPKAVEETPAAVEAPAAVEEPAAPAATTEETPAPKETSTAADIAAPVTAAAAGVAAAGAAVVATTKDSAEDAKKMSADSDLPGAFPATPADELNKEVKLVNPLPAAPGGVNPVTLAPGEKIPDEFKNGDINANVKLDPESYEKADAAIAGDFSAEQLPPVSKNLIPESSLPITGSNDVTINSAAPIATTAVLAGAVPLEKEKAAAAAPIAEAETVPEIVKKSQEAAGVAPEASAVPEEVKEKEQVEDELLKKVPEAPVTSDGTTTEATAAAAAASTSAPAAESSSTSPAAIVGGVAAGAAALGAAALGAAAVAKDKAVEQAPVVEKYANDAAAKLPVSVRQLLPTSVQEQLATTAAIGNEPVKSEVPAEVQDSIKQAGTSPEAAANATAVEEKKAVEAELLKKVDSGAPAESASASAATPAVPAAAAAAPVAPAAESSSVAPATAAAAPAAEAASATNGKESAPALVAAPAPAPAPRMAPVGNSAAAAIASASSAPASKAGVVNAEKKKKNRLSGFFHKIMDKIDGDKKK